MIIRLPCTKIPIECQLDGSTLTKSHKNGWLSSQTINKLWVHYIENTVRCGQIHRWTKSSTTWQLWKPGHSGVTMIHKLVQAFLQPCYVYPFVVFLALHWVPNEPKLTIPLGHTQLGRGRQHLVHSKQACAEWTATCFPGVGWGAWSCWNTMT